MSNIVKPGQTQLTQSSLLKGFKSTGRDLSEGVAQTFPLISLRGGKWRYRWQGQETVLVDPQTKFAVPAVEVVIIDASKTLTKTYYRDPYAEGSNRRPDCWSSDGKIPDAAVPQPVSEICLTCKMNEFGSAMTPTGKRAKACQDRRRLVIVPASDLENEAKGGPILLSIPPGSLKNSQAYGDWLDENGLAYYGCVTQLSFDQKVSHPKVEFNYLRALDDDDVRTVLSLRGGEAVKRILNSQFSPDAPEMQVNNQVEEVEEARPGPAPTPQSKPVVQTAKVGITEAVKRPAIPPASQRTVQTPGAHPVRPKLNPMPVQEEEPEETAPSPVDDAFAKLMDIE